MLPITDVGTGEVVDEAAEHFLATNQMLTVSGVASDPLLITVGEYPTSPVAVAQFTKPAPTTSVVGATSVLGAGAAAPTAAPVNARTAATQANKGGEVVLTSHSLSHPSDLLRPGVTRGS